VSYDDGTPTSYTYSSGWQEEQDIAFAYEGWNLLGELNVNDSDARLRTYLWGLDLSGSEQGAGGVGGLLKITDYTSGTTHHFVAYDGNGNVAGLVNSTNASVSAATNMAPSEKPSAPPDPWPPTTPSGSPPNTPTRNPASSIRVQTLQPLNREVDQ
jgi:hypothetical protein